MIAHAQKCVPLYRELYNRCNPQMVQRVEDLTRFPIVTKALWKASFPDRILAEDVQVESLYPVATSGTTDQVMTYHDEDKRDWDRAADWLLALEGDRFRPGHRKMLIPPDACYERCGIDQNGELQTLRTRLVELLRSNWGGRKRAARRVVTQLIQDYWWRLRILKSFGVDGTAVSDQTISNYTSAIGKWRPHVMHALPMYLFVLASHAQSSSCSSGIRIIRPSGGKTTAVMAENIESRLGGLVRENYGTSELGTVAFDCEQSRRQHLLSELFHIEFIRSGRPVAPGEVGELLITDLRNRVAPLIRYAIGDVGTYEAQPCPCGRVGLLFTVHGRLNETIVTPTGGAIPGDQVIDFFLRLPGVAFAKVIQQSVSAFLVEVVLSKSDHMLATDGQISRRFSEFMGFSADVKVRTVRRIAPERSGKYRMVESCTYERFHS